MSKKIKFYWIYDNSLKIKSEQIIVIEGLAFKFHELMDNLDGCLNQFIKKKHPMNNRIDEIKEIMENWIIQVGSDKSIKGVL